jgi:cold shock CspA family protein
MSTAEQLIDLEIGDEHVGECVRWIDRAAAFGFLRVEGAGDVFVGARALRNATALECGDKVRFIVGMDRDGRRHALHCELIEDNGDRLAMPQHGISGAPSAHAVLSMETRPAPRRVETIMRDGRQVVIHRSY